MTTIADVARHARVSTATVSRVLNGKQVNEAHANAVRAAVAELDYSPDRTARSLRRRYSDVVALVMPDVENPFFTALARGVEDVAQAAGFSVVLCNTDDNAQKEADYLDIVVSDNMAGVILAPAAPTPQLAKLRERGRIVVVVDRPITDPVDQVFFDNVALGRIATSRLVGLGHERIACVTGPREVSTAIDRAEGWRQALTETRLDIDEALLVHANFRVDGGRQAARALLALPEPPDGIVATNNLVGVGVLQELIEERGLDHGVGVAVVGDLPFATSPIDELVLVPLGPYDLGARAARMFLERLAEPAAEPRQFVQPVPATPRR